MNLAAFAQSKLCLLMCQCAFTSTGKPALPYIFCPILSAPERTQGFQVHLALALSSLLKNTNHSTQQYMGALLAQMLAGHSVFLLPARAHGLVTMKPSGGPAGCMHPCSPELDARSDKYPNCSCQASQHPYKTGSRNTPWW